LHAVFVAENTHLGPKICENFVMLQSGSEPNNSRFHCLAGNGFTVTKPQNLPQGEGGSVRHTPNDFQELPSCLKRVEFFKRAVPICTDLRGSAKLAAFLNKQRHDFIWSGLKIWAETNINLT